MTVDELTLAHRAALVVMALDEDLAAKVMMHMDEDSLREIAGAVGDLEPIPLEEVGPTLELFEAALEGPVLPSGGGDYVRKIAQNAFGKDRADSLFKGGGGAKQPAFDVIKQAQESTLAELLQEEHPQIAAVIVSQLSKSQASKVLLQMREDKQCEIIERIARLDSIPATALANASDSLAKALESSGAISTDEKSEFDGVSFAAGLMNEIATDDNERLMEDLEDRIPELAPKIREAMFTFEDLNKLDDRALQSLMREVQSDELLIALKTASEVLREKFFGVVSSRAAESMREDLEFMPPKRLSEVEEAQRSIIEAAMRMASDGQISLGTDEEMV